MLTSECVKCVSRTRSRDTVSAFIHGNAGEKQPFNDSIFRMLLLLNGEKELFRRLKNVTVTF